MYVEWAVHESISGQSDLPTWLSTLVKAWHRQGAAIVTFNYDTLVEAAVDHLRLKTPAVDDVHHQQLAPNPLPMWAGTSGGASRQHAESMTLIKLHGSTNWYCDDSSRTADSIVQIGLRSKWGEHTPSYVHGRDRAFGKVPLIVPPTTGKSAFLDNAVIRDLWHEAYLNLMGANRVFAIGYSLPLTDLLVRAMLEESIGETAELWIINMDAGVVSNYEALHVGKLRTEFCGSASHQSVSQFVNQYISGLV
jgi:hypothetical protein